MPSDTTIPAPLLAASQRVVAAHRPELLVNRPAEAALERLLTRSDFATAAAGGDRAAAHAAWRSQQTGEAVDERALNDYRTSRTEREQALGFEAGRRTVHGSIQIPAARQTPSTGATRYGEVAFVATEDAVRGAWLVPSDSFYTQAPASSVDELPAVVAARLLRTYDVVRDRGITDSPWAGNQLTAAKGALLDEIRADDHEALISRVRQLVSSDTTATHYIEAVTDGMAFDQIAEVRIDLPALVRRLGGDDARALARRVSAAAHGNSIPVTVVEGAGSA